MANSSFINNFRDMMSDEIIAVPVQVDSHNEETIIGDEIPIKCYIEGGNKLVRDAAGQQVVSSLLCLLDDVYGLTAADFRFKIPERYGNASWIKAITIDVITDEMGPVCEEVRLP